MNKTVTKELLKSDEKKDWKAHLKLIVNLKSIYLDTSKLTTA